MDYDPWDLWGPSFYPASPEGSHRWQNEWQCDFYSGYGTDVMKEDAMNEKSCIQVLRILMAKADTEINELENELVFLQSELAWFECEEWSEICRGALRERIDDLNISIRSLRDMDKNDTEVHLLVYTEPIATIHEILNAFLTKYLQEKDKQRVSKSQKQQMQKGVEAGDLNRMVMRRLMQPVRLASSDHGAVLRNSVLQAEKRRKNSISTINTVKAEEFSVQMDCSNSPRTAFGRPVKDEPLTPNSYSVGDLGTKDVKPFLPVATDVTDLRRLKMNDLRAMAKQLNLTRYYKLKKDDLVELLTSRLRSS